MTNNELDQNVNNPQQTEPENNGQVVNQQPDMQNGYYQQQAPQNGYYQQPNQNNYYQQQPTQNGYYQQQPYQNGYNPYGDPNQLQGKRPMKTSTLVLMIVGLVFSFLIPLATYACSIISLVQAVKNRKIEKTKVAIILNIVALVIAVCVHVYSTITLMNSWNF